MSDNEAEAENQHDEFDDNANQACYIFKPSSHNDSNEYRPTKRRKVTHQSLEPADEFPRLLHGAEPIDFARARRELLQQEWNHKRAHIDKTVSALDEQSLGAIAAFVTSNNDGQYNIKSDKLSTGLIVSGPDTSIQTRLLEQWRAKKTDKTREVVIQLSSSTCSNLQVALKIIIKNVISDKVGIDGYQVFLAKHKRLIPMNFDLELLQVFVEDEGIAKVVVSLLDVETFDLGVLSELLSCLRSWSDRVPFVVLLGIATSVELFGSRLPKSIVSLLDVKVFALPSSNQLQHALVGEIQQLSDTRVFLGPVTLSALNELSQGQGMTVANLADFLELAYMSHYFGNPLSVLLGKHVPASPDSITLCESIRNTPSFKKRCEVLLQKRPPSLAEIRALLDDDETLLKTAHDAIKAGQEAFRIASHSISALLEIRHKLGFLDESPFLLDSQLYSHLDDITKTDLFDETIAKLEKLNSIDLMATTATWERITVDILEVSVRLDALQAFNQLQGDSSIRSSHDSTQPTAIMKSSISPSRKNTTVGSSTAVTNLEEEYTSLLDDLVSQITSKIQSSSFNTQSTFCHEAFIFNSRQPLQSSFIPRPRFALERALGRPGDYLGCECCSKHENEDSEDNQNPPPPTSILYTLLQEAGTIINVRDLFDAFCSRFSHHSRSTESTASVNANEVDTDEEGYANEGINGNSDEQEDNDDDDQDQDQDQDTQLKRQSHQESLAVFYQSLSELKLLGLVKSSTSAMTKKRALASNEGDDGGRKKVGYTEIDFIAKTSWEGL